MPKLEMDTGKIRNVGEDLKAIAKDYNNIIEEMYEKIRKIEDNGVMIGDSKDSTATQFIEKIVKDEDTTKKLAFSMNNIGDFLIDYSSNINAIADIKITGIK